MDRGLLEHARGERLISTGRLLLAFFALVVVRLDPDVAELSASRLLPIAAVFSLYAVVALIVAWRVTPTATGYRLALHAVDFLFFSVIIELTHASVSPFFIFFLFSLLSALLRFGVKGMLITAAAAISTYLAMALFDEKIRNDPGYLIMRSISLAVATLLLAYVGVYHERIRSELTKLAAWPRTTSEQREPLILDTLRLAADLLSAPRVVLIWDDEDEPWLWCAVRDGSGEMTLTREPPDSLERMLDARARDASFLSRGSEQRSFVARNGVVSRIGTRALDAETRERFAIRDVVSAPVTGQSVSGRIFFLDRADLQLEDISVAELIARLVATRLDQLSLTTRMRAAAVTDERLRVARDLHDGLLQSLTAAALQLELVYRLAETDPGAARERLRNVQSLIEADQRELRALIMQLRPKSSEEPPTLQTRLLELADRFQRQWDVGVQMEADVPEVRPEMASEIYSLVTEGMANAAKHARASRIEVSLRASGGDLAIEIADDGCGFPFDGTYTLEELNAARRGPVTLKERVASLGGDLVLHSTPNGSRIEIRIARSAATLHA